MSGTLGALRREQQRQRQLAIKAAQENRKREQLRQNREEIIAQICKTFGWSQLDDFAQKMIDDVFAGQVVDLKKLKKDLAAWKEEQEQSDASVLS